MRALLLLAAAISATLQTAQASVVFDQSTAGTYSYSVTTDGVYDIFALGAAGGSAGSEAGGLGAAVQLSLTLYAGEPLTMIVGSPGSSGAGGGGSFLFFQPSVDICIPRNGCHTSYGVSTDIAIAGGGGGATLVQAGGAGQSSSSGAAGGRGVSGSAGGAGGVDDSGGRAGVAPQDSPAGAGGGGSNVGSDGQSSGQARGGAAQAGLPISGPAFGGGGGAGFHAGGGGGGFSGGGGGGGASEGTRFTATGQQVGYFDEGGAGGGGGSFVIDTALSSNIVAGGNNNLFGEVRITLEDGGSTPVPEPASLAVLGFGITGLVALRRYRAK